MSHLSRLPFLIGNDICRIARIREILQGRLGARFVRRILRDEEIEHPTTAGILRCILEPTAALQHAQLVSGDVKGEGTKREAEDFELNNQDRPGFKRAVEFLAGRFAAKEAVIKAHPSHRLTYRRIAILRADPSVLDASEDENGQGNRVVKGRSDGGEREVDSDVRREEMDEESQPGEGSGSAGKGGPLVAIIRASDERGCENDRDLCASVSISHDSEYATAACVGVNTFGRDVV